jgi:probable HAF family extracellular repeat protein
LRPEDINDDGLVVGAKVREVGEPQTLPWDQQVAATWRYGQETVIGTLGGATSTAYAVNNHGVVAGTSATSTGAIHGFVWRDGELTDLGEFHPSHINDQGEMIGFIGSTPHRWRDGQVVPLEDLPEARGESVRLHGINNAGTISGNLQGPEWRLIPVVWHENEAERLPSPPGVDRLSAGGINDHGHVVGGADGHVIIWKPRR